MCRRHYHEFYSHVHRPSVSSSCGARPKIGTRFSRHTPDAHLISNHLSETTGTKVTLTPIDYICYRCYTAHVSTMKDINSSNKALQKDIQTWTVTYRDTTTDTLIKSILKAGLVIADHLLQQRAVLLPHISQVFLEAYGVPLLGAVDLNLEVGDSTIKFSSWWLLHQLIIYLHVYMSYKCEHRKFGTVLFLAFVTLVGTVYFKKHIAVTSLYSYSTPAQLFISYSLTVSRENKTSEMAT